MVGNAMKLCAEGWKTGRNVDWRGLRHRRGNQESKDGRFPPGLFGDCLNLGLYFALPIIACFQASSP